MNLFKRNAKGELKPADLKTGRPADPGYAEACYYVRFDVNGRSVNRSTKCTVKSEAEKQANLIYKEELAKSLGAPSTKAPKAAPVVALPTIAQFEACYLAAPTEAGYDTRWQAVKVLRKMLSVAHPELEEIGYGKRNVAGLRIDSINAELTATWFNHYHERNARLEHDQITQCHNRNTANSEFGKVAAMFHDGLLDHYQDPKVGMFSPTFAEFRAKGAARRFKKNVSNGINAYNPPPQSVIDAMLASWLKLEDRNVFIAAGFALVYGLRKGETQQVRWGWLRPLHGGSPGLSNASDVAIVKAGHGDLTTRALDPYYSQFMARLDEMGWRGEANELVLVGCVSELESLCWERLGAWLTGLGWTTDKKSHALRAYAGSKVYMRYGLEAAKNYLRHAKAQTTESHYSHFASKWPMGDDERAEMPERWAPKVATNIVPLPVAAAA